jgi:hypothetical protein
VNPPPCCLPCLINWKQGSKRSDVHSLKPSGLGGNMSCLWPVESSGGFLTDEQATELMQAMRGAVQMPTAAKGLGAAARVKQMLESVPVVAHPVPSETEPPRSAPVRQHQAQCMQRLHHACARGPRPWHIFRSGPRKALTHHALHTHHQSHTAHASAVQWWLPWPVQWWLQWWLPWQWWMPLPV